MRITRMLALGLLLALSVTGCSKAANNGAVSASPTPEQKDLAADLQKFSQCMRENGVPEYPDPKINENGGVQLGLPPGVDKEQVDAATKLCKQYMPGGGELRKPDPAEAEKMLKFSKCMRENGVPKFPDPDENGQIKMEGSADLDPTSQVFKDAEKACAQYQPSGPGAGNNTNDG